MTKKCKILNFPNILENKKNKYINIRDDVENILLNYSHNKKDLWAVALAAGRFSAMTLQNLDGPEKTLDFFKNCIKTQRKFNLSSNSTNIT